MTRLLLYTSALLLGFLFSCSKEETPAVITTPSADVITTIQYKNIQGVVDNLLSLDIYHTDDLITKKPVVIWVHGGAWVTGDKANKIESKRALFQSEGWILVSTNYRLGPFPYEIDNPDRIMYPIHNIDFADAIRWVYDNINKYGGDPENIVLLGHSAGAHLVSLAGTKESFLEDVGLDLKVLKGVATFDTEAYDLPQKMEEFNELFINAFGTELDTQMEASPFYNISVNENYPPFFVAKRGLPGRVASADAFISRLEQAGTFVDEIEASVYDHAGINDAIGAEGESIVTPPLIAFFKECFK